MTQAGTAVAVGIVADELPPVLANLRRNWLMRPALILNRLATSLLFSPSASFRAILRSRRFNDSNQAAKSMRLAASFAAVAFRVSSNSSWQQSSGSYQHGFADRT